jgi:hypothetical protein
LGSGDRCASRAGSARRSQARPRSLSIRFVPELCIPFFLLRVQFQIVKAVQNVQPFKYSSARLELLNDLNVLNFYF